MSQQFPYQQNPTPVKQGLSKGTKRVLIGCLAIAVSGAIILIVVGTLGYWGLRKTADGVAQVKSDYDRRMGIDPELTALTNACSPLISPLAEVPKENSQPPPAISQNQQRRDF